MEDVIRENMKHVLSNAMADAIHRRAADKVATFGEDLETHLELAEREIGAMPFLDALSLIVDEI